jgi:hypothetical protein
MDPYTRKSLYSIKIPGREKWIGELENYIVNKLATPCDTFILGSVQIPSVSFSTSHNNKQQHRIPPQHNNSHSPPPAWTILQKEANVMEKWGVSREIELRHKPLHKNIGSPRAICYVLPCSCFDAMCSHCATFDPGFLLPNLYPKYSKLFIPLTD